MSDDESSDESVTAWVLVALKPHPIDGAYFDLWPYVFQSRKEARKFRQARGAQMEMYRVKKLRNTPFGYLAKEQELKMQQMVEVRKIYDKIQRGEMSWDDIKK